MFARPVVGLARAILTGLLDWPFWADFVRTFSAVIKAARGRAARAGEHGLLPLLTRGRWPAAGETSPRASKNPDTARLQAEPGLTH